MSGTALKSIPTQRVNAQEHQRIAAVVMNELRLSGFSRIEVLPYYAGKTDFGNLSIFVQGSKRGVSSPLAKSLAHVLGSPEYVVNDNRVSLSVQGLQVDISVYPKELFQVSLDYHSYNGLGGLLGRLADSVGLVLREHELVYPVRLGDYWLADVCVANSWPQVLEVLGLDMAQWCKGFESQEALFGYVATSPLFGKSLFEGLSSAAAAAGASLNAHQLMAAWLQTPAAQALRARPLTSAQHWHETLMARRPELRQAVDAVLARHQRRILAHDKLNGQVVAQWTGCSGVVLGGLLKKLQSPHASSEAFADWVLATPLQDIKHTVEQLHAAVA